MKPGHERKATAAVAAVEGVINAKIPENQAEIGSE